MSIEFFLVVAFVLVLATILVSNVDTELREGRAIDSAALAKAAVVEVSHLANSIAVQGNGSLVRREVFIPSQTMCFQYNSTTRSLYCNTGTVIVRGPTLLATPTVVPSCLFSGWLSVSVSNDGSVRIDCTQLS